MKAVGNFQGRWLVQKDPSWSVRHAIRLMTGKTRWELHTYKPPPTTNRSQHTYDILPADLQQTTSLLSAPSRQFELEYHTICNITRWRQPQIPHHRQPRRLSCFIVAPSQMDAFLSNESHDLRLNNTGPTTCSFNATLPLTLRVQSWHGGMPNRGTSGIVVGCCLGHSNPASPVRQKNSEAKVTSVKETKIFQ